MTASPSELQLQVFVSPAHPIGNDGLTFSPTTSTLIYGQREAILVDAQFIKDDVVRQAVVEHVARRFRKTVDFPAEAVGRLRDAGR